MVERNRRHERELVWEEREYREYIDPGIVDLVKALHHDDVETLMSCEGHIRESAIYVGVLPWPWVVIFDRADRVNTLSRRIDEWNRLNPDQEWILSGSRIHGSLTPDYIRGSLTGKKPGTMVTALTPMDENLELSEEKLRSFQEQVSPLADFIEHRRKRT